MHQKEFNNIKAWFSEHTSKYYSNIEAFQKNIELKKNHSYRVWENAADLGKSLELGANDQLLLETAALLHDVGRFKQFKEYGTFSDKKSVNHAWLSTEVIKEHKLLVNNTKEEEQHILTAVYNHNKKVVPPELEAKDKTFVTILRDADKLDIWRVVTEYYCRVNGETNNTLQLDLPDKPGFNRINYEDLQKQKMVDLNNLETLNDFKLLQVSWVYDLNFRRSFEIANNKGYLEKIFNSLPSTNEIKKIRSQVNLYLREMLS